MLVKLALVNAKLENIPEKDGGRTIFNFFWGGHSCYEGNWGCVGGVEWGDNAYPEHLHMVKLLQYFIACQCCLETNVCMLNIIDCLSYFHLSLY